jgi:hypothetical protein
MVNTMTLQEEVDLFLDELRETGAVNMFGAAPYVVAAFGVTRWEARSLVVNWMENFGKRNPQ